MSEVTACYETLTSHLRQAGYLFICPSPETQSRVVRKRSCVVSTADAKTAPDFFGWNLSCTRQVLSTVIPDALFEGLLRAAIISREGEKYRSTIRVSNFYLPGSQSSQDDSLFYIHSSFPASSNSVFFGPDTYLFIAFLQKATVHFRQAPKSIVDVCCGSGAGAIHLARTYPEAQAIGLDLNPKALGLGGVNANLAGAKVDFSESNLYAAISRDMKLPGIDLIVSNPPYIASSTSGKDLPIYADGGAEFGLGISMRIVEEGIGILATSGVIVIYTGVAIPTAKPGHDAFLEKLEGVKDVELLEYTILHPDMWPEEIGQGAYAYVCRIQVVGAVLRKK